MSLNNLIKKEKAQASLETLLIIGGAVAIAAVVGFYLKTQAAQSLTPQAQSQQAEIESQLSK